MPSIQIGSNFVSYSLALMNMDTYTTPAIILTQWGHLIWGSIFFCEVGKRKKGKKKKADFTIRLLVNTRNRIEMSPGGCGASSQVQMQSFRSEFYTRNACSGGFLMSSVHNQILHIDAHTHTHTSLSSARKHPCILPLRTVSC